MKLKLIILTFLLLSLIIVSGCSEVETQKIENKTSIDYSKGVTTTRVNIVSRKENTTLNSTFS